MGSSSREADEEDSLTVQSVHACGSTAHRGGQSLIQVGPARKLPCALYSTVQSSRQNVVRVHDPGAQPGEPMGGESRK